MRAEALSSNASAAAPKALGFDRYRIRDAQSPEVIANAGIYDFAFEFTLTLDQVEAWCSSIDDARFGRGPRTCRPRSAQAPARRRCRMQWGAVACCVMRPGASVTTGSQRTADQPHK